MSEDPEADAEEELSKLTATGKTRECEADQQGEEEEED